MSKQDLFKDLSAEEMRLRLQEVSEQMDEVIDERRRQLRQQNMKRDDLLDDPMWNLAHDVLETIHCLDTRNPEEAWGETMAEVVRRCCPILEGAAKSAAENAARLAKKTTMSLVEAASMLSGTKQNTKLGDLFVTVGVDTSQLDKAVEKIERYSEVIDDKFTRKPFLDLARLTTPGKIFTLVTKYGWGYAEAKDFALMHMETKTDVDTKGYSVVSVKC